MTNRTGNNLKRVISLTSLGVVLIVAVIVVNIVIWQNNNTKQSDVNLLKSEISRVQGNIAGIPAPPADLDARLAAANAAFNEAKNGLPGEIDTNDVMDYLINVAEQCRVEAVPLASEGAASVSGKSYLEYDFSVTVTGSLANAADYVASLEGNDFPTLIILDCSVSKIEGTDFTKLEKDMQVTVNLSIAVYVASPTADEGGAS
jgi:hypothetical protein